MRRPETILTPLSLAVDKLGTTRDKLLAWYDYFGRELAWRVKTGPRDPYKIWLSEVMLQQTTVATVAPYYAKFLSLYPDVAALARAPRDQVLEAWAGLGYYSRARNLHAAAQKLAAEGFPDDEVGWRTLPGVGPYTAAAIAAIALDQPANAIDGNIERVMARLFAVEKPLPEAKAELRELAGRFITSVRPGDWVQALMDLGATVCTPKQPKCAAACPISESCAAFSSGKPETYPRRGLKAAKPQRFGIAFRLERGAQIFLVRRPDKGLLGGMAALPTTPWREEQWSPAEAVKHAPAKAKWVSAGIVRHIFTHFALELDVWTAAADTISEGWWSSDLGALPTVFRKAALAQPSKEKGRRGARRP